MLATLTDERFSREGWIFEPKLDGERCLVYRKSAKLELFSRNRKPLNLKYPELTEALRSQNSPEFIADGEIVAFEGELTSFSRLQQRMQNQQPSAALLKAVPVWFYLFDLLHLDGYDLRQVPLRSRKQLLEHALEFSGPLRYLEHVETEGEEFYRAACERGWEGVIAKNAGSVYESGRSRQWLKFKCVLDQEFVIGGYTDPEGQRSEFGALLVGYYERGKLKYAGKVGTGYNTRTLQQIGKRLKALEQDRSPFADGGPPRGGVHWVEPRLVAQIGFTEWTRDGKLRHPRFLGLREDKDPARVVRESPAGS